ncbi:HSP20-like chaperone [Daldinia caldariorum]|uniref:HSP20-like chaperone n=1 Tax=Daldinia caldariorum TaxID=326644 RepID=UPI00200745AC|nr:HSP20-like chaperone [Daldinia caldariorum]KAI1468764.1 HSP20-like chaperone [Daldinia caldariorum]
MASNNNNQPPFWEFMQSFGPNGAGRGGVGIDHASFGPQFPPGFPFDAAQFNPWMAHGWGLREGHGRDGHQQYRDAPGTGREEDHDDTETESSPETLRHTPEESVTGDAPPPPPPGAFPNHPPAPGAFPHPHGPPPPGAPNHPPHPPFHQGHPPFHHGHPHPFGPRRRRGSRCGRGGRRGPHASTAYSGPWDFRPLMHALSAHPFAEAFREYMVQVCSGPSGESNEHQDEIFAPPVDVFNTEKAYVLHVSLPGALKEDIGVHWNGERINIAGVVCRPGNDEFLQSLTSSERKIGMFERSIKLPPPGSDEKEDIDGLGVSAKMENGILIVTVPKIEKEWTEIHKVDIE